MPIDNVDESLRQGLLHHQAGRFQEAEQVYRAVLASNENCAPAWHLLGALAHQVGHSTTAVQMIERAIQLGSKNPEVFNNLGECYRAVGRLPDAANAYQTAIQLNPNYVEAMCNLGQLFNNAGRSADALPVLERVVSIRPDFADGHFHYGIALQNTGDLVRAIQQFEMTLQFLPNNPLVMKQLGLCLHQAKRMEEAQQVFWRLVQNHPEFVEGLESYSRILQEAGKVDQALEYARRATEIAPGRAEAFNNLGVVYSQMERFDDAISAMMTALSLNPDHFDSVANIGCIYSKTSRFEEAATWLERALELKPHDSTVSNVLHSVYYLQGQVEKSLATIERALQFHPQSPDLHFNRAGLLLALGRLSEGFEEYEWRWRAGGFEYLHARQFTQPQWDGSNPAGKTIVVHAEQGYGDVIQGARYLPILLKKGARLIVVVPQEVCSLIESIKGIDLVTHHVETVGLKFDLHMPLLGFPRAFRTTLETIPNSTPYLFPNPALVEKIRPVIDSHARGLKIGLVWGGSPVPYPGRSTTIKELSILADVPNVSWYSFQVDHHRAQLNDAPPQMNILDLGKDFKNFADTAAAMSQMDLVITIDTGSAHLAGALGMKTWVMLAFACDWRWLTKGETTAWYPTMRLIRQKKLGDWSPVVEKIRSDLLELVQK